MPNSTTNYNLKKPLSNENYNIQDSNDNMDIIDTALKYLDDKIDDLAGEGNTKTVKQLENEVTSHKAEDASLSAKGHVQLYDGTDSTSTALAATANAVKAAMDKANQAFQSASDGKSLISGAITGVDDSVVIPTDPTFQQLATAISEIKTGALMTAGDTITIYNDTTQNQVSYDWTSYREMKAVNIKYLGRYRVSFDLRAYSGGTTAYARLYLNGKAVGIERTHNTGDFVTFTEDIDVPTNARLSVYGKSDGQYGNWIANFQIKINDLCIPIDV